MHNYNSMNNETLNKKLNIVANKLRHRLKRNGFRPKKSY